MGTAIRDEGNWLDSYICGQVLRRRVLFVKLNLFTVLLLDIDYASYANHKAQILIEGQRWPEGYKHAV